MNRLFLLTLLFFSVSGVAQVVNNGATTPTKPATSTTPAATATPAPTTTKTPAQASSAANAAEWDLETLYEMVSQIDTAQYDVYDRVALLEIYTTKLHEALVELNHRSDSIDNALGVKIVEAKALSKSNHNEATEKIQVVETSSQTNYNRLAMWGLWSIVGLLVVAIVVYIMLHHGISKSRKTLASMRQTQESLNNDFEKPEIYEEIPEVEVSEEEVSDEEVSDEEVK